MADNTSQMLRRLGRWPATDTMGPRTLGWLRWRPLTETQAVQDQAAQRPLLNMEQAGVAQGTKQALMTPWTQADRNPLALVQALVMGVLQAQVERDPVAWFLKQAVKWRLGQLG